MSTNMDGPEQLIQEVLDLPVEDLQTLLVAVTDRLRPLASLIANIPVLESRYNVDLFSADPNNKIQTIKEIRAITQLGLKEAKDIVDSVLAGTGPERILTGVDEVTMDVARSRLVSVNAQPQVL